MSVRGSDVMTPLTRLSLQGRYTAELELIRVNHAIAAVNHVTAADLHNHLTRYTFPLQLTKKPELHPVPARNSSHRQKRIQNIQGEVESKKIISLPLCRFTSKKLTVFYSPLLELLTTNHTMRHLHPSLMRHGH